MVIFSKPYLERIENVLQIRFFVADAWNRLAKLEHIVKQMRDEYMVVALTLRENRVEIVAGKGSSPLSSKKRLSLTVGDGFIKNGKIVSPHFLGKLLIAELKKHRIMPGKLLIAMRSNDIMIDSIQISDCSKDSVLQRAKEFLEAEQPGILEKSHIICRHCNDLGGSFSLNVAIVPKILVEQYYALASAMKCKISKLAIYADCVEKLLLKESGPVEEERIFVEIGGDFTQFYHFEGGELQRIYGFITGQIPFHYSEDMIRKDLLDKICQDILALSHNQEKDGGRSVYLNNAGYLADLEVRYMEEQLNEAGHLQYAFMQEQDSDGSLLNTLFSDNKKGENLSEVPAGRGRNYAKSNRFSGIFLVAAVGAFLATMSFGFFWYVSAGRLYQKLTEDEVFVSANESIKDVFLEHGKLKEEKQYVEKLNQYLEAVDFDFRVLQDRLEEIMEQGESTLDGVLLTPDFKLRVEASTSSYLNIDKVMKKMEEAGLETVELLLVQSVNEQENPINYTISAAYVMETDQTDATASNDNSDSR